MPRDQKEFERLEQIVLRSAGDGAEALGCGLERLDECIANMQEEICRRLAELEEGISKPAVGSAN